MTTHVLIVGAGIGGLCLASGFKKHGVSFHVFEKEAAHAPRRDGHRIRLAREGVEALRYLLDDETWRLFELTCGITDDRPMPEIDAATAKVARNDEHARDVNRRSSRSSAKVYTVDRALFREVMLRGLRSRVSFGKLLRRYDLKTDGVSAVFDDGSTWHGSLLVGADGAHSITRRQFLPNYRLLDGGSKCLYGRTDLTLRALRDLLPSLSEGGIHVIKDRTQEPFPVMILEAVIFPERDKMRQEDFDPPTDYLSWSLTFRPEVLDMDDQGQCHLTSEECESLALRLSQDWHPQIRAVLQHQMSGQTELPRSQSVPPEFKSWESNTRVTLLGNAIHPIVATSDYAVITTVRDAQNLCQLIVEQDQSDHIISQYEDRMRIYAADAIQRTQGDAEAIFRQTGRTDENIAEIMMASRSAEQTHAFPEMVAYV